LIKKAKTILLTGVSGYLGIPLAINLIKEGHYLIGVSRSKPKNDFLIKSKSYKHIDIDLCKEKGVRELVKELKEQNINVDVLINNARSTSHYKFKNGKQSLESIEIDLYFAVSLPYLLSMELAELGRLNSIINIGSQYGVVVANPRLYEDFTTSAPISYAISKAALHHLTKELAVRLAPSVRVNCLALGGIEGKAAPEFIEKYSEFLPLSRMLTIDEAVKPILAIVNDNFNAMTGAIINVDGGWTLS